MRRIVEAAREKFDYIVVDLPPLAPVVDAKAFAQMADGFLLVTEWGSTPRNLVRSLLQAEPQVAGKVLGVILNKTDMKLLSRYGAYGSSEHYLHAYSGYYIQPSNINAAQGDSYDKWLPPNAWQPRARWDLSGAALGLVERFRSKERAR